MTWTPDMDAELERRLRAVGRGQRGGWYAALRRAASEMGRSLENVRARARRIGLLHRLNTETGPSPAEVVPAPVPAPVPVDPTDARLRAYERRIVRLQDEVRDLAKKLRASDRQHGIVEELAARLPDYVRPLHLSSDIEEALRQPPEPPGDAESVDAVAMWTDQHADRRVSLEGSWGLEQYDFGVFTARLWKYAKTIRAYATQHLPNYKFRTLWVLHLGDAVNGDIHDAALRNSFPNSIEAAIATGDVQTQALLYLADAFERVVVVCVPGNHGRMTPKMEYTDPYNNLDYLVARTMQLRLSGTSAERRIQVITPRSYSAYVDIRGWLWALNHGTGVKGTWGVPWYGFERREGRVQRLVETLNRRVDMFAYGHFHTPMLRPNAIHGGAWYFTDEWSVNTLSAGHEPVQQLLMASERFPVQMSIPIHLRDMESENRMRAGLWVPPFGAQMLDAGAVAATGQLPVIT